ncbi:hypothetical protein WH50_21295 [Pokkaliibacter plantistimulans]|uniref:CheW-like domain-containing protein n=1 Tax=Pokkaliibacter plantistimulans TaxID=1635171 RepID=A0ABX5LSY3_9GAMM|nr:chemotaxis protein CheW [Pokkaliibacter plantistimulans]PXF29312.1 hypothetical protein WH50_21295 [Pokkaliibacter plantistimulans]
MKRRNAQSSFAEPRQALESYLESLLSEVPEYSTEGDDPVLDATPDVIVGEVVLAGVQEPVNDQVEEQPAAPEDRVPAEQPVIAETQVILKEESSVDGGQNLPPELGKPGWAVNRFECLLFNVSGLKLAVPLIELGGVLTIPEKGLTPLFGQAKWFMGLLPAHGGRMIRVVDTALWVMPDRYDEEQRKSMKYVILIEGSDWGLGCHDVAEAITLGEQEVRWRSERSKRPWLAGTVIDHMCAIMDVGTMSKMLNADDKNYQPKLAKR